MIDNTGLYLFAAMLTDQQRAALLQAKQNKGDWGYHYSGPKLSLDIPWDMPEPKRQSIPRLTSAHLAPGGFLSPIALDLIKILEEDAEDDYSL